MHWTVGILAFFLAKCSFQATSLEVQAKTFLTLSKSEFDAFDEHGFFVVDSDWISAEWAKKYMDALIQLNLFQENKARNRTAIYVKKSMTLRYSGNQNTSKLKII